MDKLVDEIAEGHNVAPELIERLVVYEQTKVHLERRRGAKDELRRVIEQHIEEQEQ